MMGSGVVICADRGADLHVARLMPLPLTVCCFSKMQICLVPVSPRKGAVKCVSSALCAVADERRPVRGVL